MTRNADLAARMFGRPMPAGRPVESLRPGALPASDFYQPPPPTPAQFGDTIREMAWEEESWRGRWEDGTPRVRSMGGLIVTPGNAPCLPRKQAGRHMVLAFLKCEPCDMEFISQESLAAHRQEVHGEGGLDTPACPACPVCGGPMPMPGPGPTARFCSGPCWSAYQARRAGEPAAG